MTSTAKLLHHSDGGRPVTNPVNPVLRTIVAELPGPSWTTDELLEAAGDRFSDALRDMLSRLGIDRRYSVLANYPAVLFAGADPELAVPASSLAARAVRACIDKSGVRPEDIGLVLGVSSSPARLLPSLVCDLFVRVPELPRSAMNLSIEYMGCSAIAKAVDCARWFLTTHPDQLVLVCFMEAITPLSPPLPGRYAHFSEVSPAQRQSTVDAMHGFLFADAAVAMILGADGSGPVFGPVEHCTNAHPEDAELGTVPDGGSDVPVVTGPRRVYTLSPDVTARGTFYATHTVERLLARPDVPLREPRGATALLMHTGSRRILDGLCDQFHVRTDSPAAASSYRILRDYGNTLGCSVPLMLADSVRRPAGHALLVAFGLSFSSGAFIMDVPEGGWMP